MVKYRTTLETQSKPGQWKMGDYTVARFLFVDEFLSVFVGFVTVRLVVEIWKNFFSVKRLSFELN